MKKILFFCLVMMFSLKTFAGSLAGGYPLCVTKKLYEQFMSAYMRGDEQECVYLLKEGSGCFLLSAELPVSVLEESIWSSQAKIRLHATGTILWTHFKNIKK